MEVSVVIPVNNEAGNIDRLVVEVEETLAGVLDFEIVVVNDGSTDETAALLEAAQRRSHNLRVIEHEHCCGQSTSLLTGVLAAGGEIIATLDGDGQNDPQDIPGMVEALRNGYEATNIQLIAGHRQKRQDSRWRLFCSRVANRIRTAMLQDATPDSGCGSKVFYRDTFLHLPYFDHMHRFLPALVLRTGAGVESFPVHHRERERGRSHYGTIGRLIAGIVDICGVMWLTRRARKPIAAELTALPLLRVATADSLEAPIFKESNRAASTPPPAEGQRITIHKTA